MEIYLGIAVDSKDLYDTLTTCHNASDSSIRVDINVIRLEFEALNISKMVLIASKPNLADAGTKLNSAPLTQFVRCWTLIKWKLCLINLRGDHLLSLVDTKSFKIHSIVELQLY